MKMKQVKKVDSKEGVIYTIDGLKFTSKEMAYEYEFLYNRIALYKTFEALYDVQSEGNNLPTFKNKKIFAIQLNLKINPIIQWLINNIGNPIIEIPVHGAINNYEVEEKDFNIIELINRKDKVVTLNEKGEEENNELNLLINEIEDVMKHSTVLF